VGNEQLGNERKKLQRSKSVQKGVLQVCGIDEAESAACKWKFDGGMGFRNAVVKVVLSGLFVGSVLN